MIGREQAERELQDALQQWEQFFTENQQAHNLHQEHLSQMAFDNTKLRDDLKELMSEYKRLSITDEDTPPAVSGIPCLEGEIAGGEEISKKDLLIKSLTKTVSDLQTRLREERLQKEQVESELEAAQNEWKAFSCKNQQVHNDYEQQLKELKHANRKLKEELERMNTKFMRSSKCYADYPLGKDVPEEVSYLRKKLEDERLLRDKAEKDLESAEGEWEQFHAENQEAYQCHVQQLAQLESKNSKLKKDLKKLKYQLERAKGNNNNKSTPENRRSFVKGVVMKSGSEEIRKDDQRALAKGASGQQWRVTGSVSVKKPIGSLQTDKVKLEMKLIKTTEIVSDLKYRLRKEQQNRLQKALEFK